MMLATSIGCARHQEQLAPLQSLIKKNPKQTCEAHFNLNAQAGDDHIVTEASLYFELNDKLSKADLKILNPLLMPIAKLSISKSHIQWIDQDGEKDIVSNPLFSKWFQPNWWQEFAFLFGFALKETTANILENQNHQFILMQRESRSIRCSYDLNARWPTSCSIEDQSFSATLNFTSAECRTPI